MIVSRIFNIQVALESNIGLTVQEDNVIPVGECSTLGMLLFQVGSLSYVMLFISAC